MITLEERIRRFRKADLYVVITGNFCLGRDTLLVLDDVLAAGVGIVQMREKDLDDLRLYERAVAFRRKTEEAGALFIVNDRLDIALASGADGVHLGQDDLPVAAAREVAPDLLAGVSTHDLEEALAAQKAGAGYVNIGPIFPTDTKGVASGAVGPEMIARIQPHLEIPFSVMGGVKEGNVEKVTGSGARQVAVVTAVTEAENIIHAARNLRSKICSSRGKQDSG